MAGDLAVVLALLAGAIVLFLLGRPRADAVALLMLVLLPLTGSVTVGEALEGFSNPNIVFIATLFVIGEGLARTGVAQRVGDWLMRHGRTSERRLVILLMIAIGAMGSIMSSAAVIAVFIPIVLRVVQEQAISGRRLFMPMGVAGAISGMLTLVATTPNLIISSMLVYEGYAGFSFFDITPVGLAVMAAGIVYILVARRMLRGDVQADRRTRPSIGNWVTRYALRDRAYRVRVAPDSMLAGRSVGACSVQWGDDARVIAIERGAGQTRAVLHPTPDHVIEPGDVLLLDADTEAFDVPGFCATQHLERLPMSGAYFADQSRDVGMVEVIIPPESGLIDGGVRDAAALRLHGLAVMGVWRGRKALGRLRGARIRAGDTLLVVGPWKDIFSMQADTHDLVSLALPVESEALVPAPEKAPHALCVLGVVLLLLLTGWVPNVIAGLIGCLLMGVSGCMTLEIAYRAINWRSLILIVGMLPFAVALKHSGGVDLAAEFLLHLTGGWGIYGQLGVIFLATVVLGIAISGTATAVLMGPVAIGMAEALHGAPHAFAMTVAVAASAAFMSPVSTAANALISAAGGYRFSDYLKVGTPLMVIALGITVVLVPWLFPA